MNVFVLCTGRCGSTTLIKACHHIQNFSAAHESRSNRLGASRFRYPENHIEADNRLSWLLGRLEETYGDRAFYVHLQRDLETTAQSFVKRYHQGIIKAYRGDGILLGLAESTDPLAVAKDYCHTVTANITAFLKGKPHQMDFHLETAQADFANFCDRIGAEVNLEVALEEFQVRYNASATAPRWQLWKR